MDFIPSNFGIDYGWRLSMKRLTIFLLGLSILIPSGFTLQAMKKSDLSALKRIGVRWNIPFIPDYKLPVIPKYGPQVSLVGTVGAAGVGCKVGCLITEMIKSSPKKADEFLKEHTNIKGALKIGHILLQTITPIPWGFRKINKALEGQSWFENMQNLFAQPATWGVVGGGLLGWYAYSKLYRYTKDGLIKDVEKCAEILDRYKHYKKRVSDDQMNIMNVLTKFTGSKDEMVLKMWEEYELVLPIIDSLIEDLKGAGDYDQRFLLDSFRDVIKHNKAQLGDTHQEALYKKKDYEINKKNANAQAKIANTGRTRLILSIASGIGKICTGTLSGIGKIAKCIVKNKRGALALVVAGGSLYGLATVTGYWPGDVNSH